MKKIIVLMPIMILLINAFTSCSAIKNSGSNIYDDVYLDPVADRTYFYEDKKLNESNELKTVREVNREAYNNGSYSSINSPTLFQNNYYPNSYLNLGFGASSIFGVNPMFPGYGIYNAYQLPGTYFSTSYHNGLMPFYSGGLNNYMFMNDPFFMNSMAYNNPYSFYNNGFYNNPYSFYNNGFYSPFNSFNSMYGYPGYMNNFFWTSQGNMNPNYIRNNVAHYGPRVSHSGANSPQVINPNFRGERRGIAGVENNTDQPRPVVRPRGSTTIENYDGPIINSSPSTNPNTVRPRSQQASEPMVNEQQPVRGKRGRLAEFFNSPPENNTNHQEWNNQPREMHSQPNFPSNGGNGNFNRGSGGGSPGGGNVIRPRR